MQIFHETETIVKVGRQQFIEDAQRKRVESINGERSRKVSQNKDFLIVKN
jgi:hypothetical protein